MKKKEMVSLSFLFFVVSSIICVVSGASVRDIMQRTLPAYAATFNSATILNSSACGHELEIFRDAVDFRKLWAIKMLDSSGKPESSFIYGNSPWLGSRFECLDIANKKPFALNGEFLRNVSRFRKAEDEFPPYEIDYFVAHFRHNSTLQNNFRLENWNVITLGLCLPASCTTDELSLILEKMFRNRTLMFGELYAADFQLMYVKDLKDDFTWLLNWRMIIVLLLIVLTILLMIAGTAYDVLFYQTYYNVKETASDILQRRNRKNSSDVAEAGEDVVINFVDPKIEEPKLFYQILKCFSVYSNTKYIFITDVGPGSIRSIDGLKGITIIWVMVVHVPLYMHDTTRNMTQGWRSLSEFWGMGISNASFAVDTFFFISGFLMAYYNFKHKFDPKTENQHATYKHKIGEFINVVTNRLMRLTPAYIMTIGIGEMAFAWHNKTSIFRLSFERPHETCGKYWWRNVLYISNFFPHNERCLSWLWYMSCDMQFFILGEFLIILSSLYFYTVAIILGVLFVGCSVIAGYIAYINGYETTLDEEIHWLDELYFPPWTRFNPYIVGIATAYIILRLKNKLTLRPIYVVALWFLSSICNTSVLFNVWNQRLSVPSSAYYMAISRSVWSIGIAWVLIACCTDNAGIVNNILSWRGWVPFSKLSYSIFLINPIIITSVFLQSNMPSALDYTASVVTIAGFIFGTFTFSYVYSVAMESPYVRLVRLFRKRATK